ncbi:MAG: ATP-grasp domain-containing protein [Oscillospiraceae bacterium]|jgi:biotin carboxylase
MKKKRLLILGAGFLQTHVIRKAKELGYYVIAVDGNPHAPGFSYADASETIDIVDTERCLAFAKKQQIDGVMTAATDYGVVAAAVIAETLLLPGIGAQTARTVRDKYAVHELLRGGKVDDSMPAYEVASHEDIVKIAPPIEYPVMIKPCNGSGSRGVIRADNEAELHAAFDAAGAASKTGKALIERFIGGAEYGAEAIVYNGVPFVLAIMKKWMTQPPYYAELGHAVRSGLSETLEEKVRKAVEQAIFSLGIHTGAVNMDFLISHDETIYIIDVGARMGGNLIGSHIVPMGTGYDYMGNLIRIAVNDPVDRPEITHIRPVATRLLALSPGTVKHLPDFDAIEKRYGVSIIHRLTVGSRIAPYRTNLDGCGYVIATGSDVVQPEKRVSAALLEVEQSIVRC